MFSSVRLVLLPICLVLAVFLAPAAVPQQFKVLVVTETDGWHHQSIADGVDAMEELAATHYFEMEIQQEGMKLTEESLRGVAAVVFISTTGDIFDADEQAAFEKYIQSGGGYVGVHAASDTEYEWEWYTKLVGRMFRIHPAQQTAKLRIVDKNFPGLEHFPDTLLWTDEWYEFQEELVDDLNYLIRVDDKTFDPEATWPDRVEDEDGNLVDLVGVGMGDFHPISWYHEYDGGRSFYTALGHIEKVFENRWFLEHLYGGIYWAATGKGIE